MSKSRGLTEQIEPAAASSQPSAKSADSLIYGIRWPANRLTYRQLQALRQISKDVRLPITQLLKDAVDVYLFVLEREMQAVMVAEQAARPEFVEWSATDDQGVESQPQTPAASLAPEGLPPPLPGFLF